MPRGYTLYTIDTTILGNNSKSTKKTYAGKPLDLRDSRHGGVAAGGGAQ